MSTVFNCFGRAHKRQKSGQFVIEMEMMLVYGLVPHFILRIPYSSAHYLIACSSLAKHMPRGNESSSFMPFGLPLIGDFSQYYSINKQFHHMCATVFGVYVINKSRVHIYKYRANSSSMTFASDFYYWSLNFV